MRAYQLQEDSDSLELVELPEPDLGPEQVRVRMRAASLNYRDLLIAQDNYGQDLDWPLIPLSDGAGEIIEVGDEVTDLSEGDRVAGNFFQEWSDGPFDAQKAGSALGGAIDGVLAEEVVFNAKAAVEVPDHLSFEEAATLPCAGVTAWVGLSEMGALDGDQTILAMGTGGVSIFAVQLAKSVGARVLLTSSHDSKLERGRQLGADETVNYEETPNWDEWAHEVTDGRGADQILEVGGEATFRTALGALREGGHLVLVGLLSGDRADADEARDNDRNIDVDSVYVGSAAHFEALNEHIERTGMTPVVDRVFDFEQAADAFGFLESGEHFGKVVIRV